LVTLQNSDGSLPSYVDAESHTAIARVNKTSLLTDLARHPGGDRYIRFGLESLWSEDRFVNSAESACSLLALSETARLLPNSDSDRDVFLASARNLAGWIEQWVYPENRWIDFEVYYSCSPKSLDFYDHRSGQWPQNTLCMHTAAAGFLVLFEITGDKHYHELAQRALDRMSLYQQVWDPPFLNIYGFGGYGVMNTDGEWNDARQAQFADTHLDFYHAFGNTEQLERAIAACRASFTTIFLPVSAGVYPTGWNREPRGLAAENHAHGGSDGLCGVSGFDWGSGSALATAAYFRLRGIDV
jgi:hypothetical protein